MVFTYRKHPFTQGDTEEKSDAKLSRDELASAFSLQASSIRIKRPDGVAAVIENAQDDIIYTVHGSPAAQGGAPAGLGGNLNTRVHVDRVLAPFTTVPTMIDKKRMEGLLSSDLGSKFYGPDTLVKDYPCLFQSGGTYDDEVVGALKTALDTPLRRHEDSEMVWGSFWDRMFLDLWTCLKLVIARNQEDKTMTKQRAQRDFYGYCRDFFLVVGEDKSCGESLGAAEKDLKDKNNTFATSGSSIRFYQMDNQSTPELISVTSPLDASFLRIRVDIIKIGLNHRCTPPFAVVPGRPGYQTDYVKKAVDVLDKSQLLRLIKLYTKSDLVCFY
ncbi:hypothetical protein PROFUN_14940 [Planoprotostelium fungivorum]|uniref:Uncharacterized protein n=1 Tax=Planoprotostelium fungivorum TaxID=1890364 RepID=A0A2P6MYD7_9EUKA|nr:hypothetical protein PROFUN_14940 [Planoprotostelium fungivorum]